MKIIIISFIFCLSCRLYAQGSDINRQLQGNQIQLDRVKNEIEQLRKDITKTSIQTSSTLEQIKVLDHEIALLNHSKKLLEKENSLLGERINLTRDQLEISRRKLKSLKDQYVARVVHLYKYGKIQNIELLLGAASIDQMLIRYKYLKFFNDQEKLVLKNINMRIEEIERLERELSLDYQKQRLSLQMKQEQQHKYLARKKEKNQLVSKLKINSQNLSIQLKTAEKEYQKLYQLIVSLERKRKNRLESGETSIDYTLNLKDFKKNKGKLPWPVKGTVIHRFGKQRNQALKTTINYTGIDIKAKTGSEVRAVFVGIVSMITYLSGYGNTIILDHGDGYYTVYSHLDEFFVEPDAFIEAGQVIGLVGDSGSLEGSKLHFAVFANQQTENPQNWLR